MPNTIMKFVMKINSEQNVPIALLQVSLHLQNLRKHLQKRPIVVCLTTSSLFGAFTFWLSIPKAIWPVSIFSSNNLQYQKLLEAIGFAIQL